MRFLTLEKHAFPGAQGLEPQWASSDPGPEKNLEEQENMERLHREILGLPDKFRLPLVLRTFENMDDQEIGGVLGLSVSNVRVRIHRAKALLWQRHTVEA